MNRKEQALLPQAYTIEQIDKMAKEWDLGSFGMAMDARVRQFDKQQKLTFVEIGYICLKVEQTEAWREMYGGGKFKSFGGWITDAAPSSRSTAYAAMGEVKKAIEDKMPLDVMNKIPRCNIKVLNGLSTEVKKKPDIIEAAQKLEERDFRRKIEKEHPLQHVEDVAPMRFKPEKSQRKKIDAAIEAVTLLNPDTSRREDCLEVLAVEYLENHEVELRKAMAKAARA